MLINCVAYQQGQKLADIPIGRINEHLKKPDTFVWVAMRDPSPDELEAMRDQFDLHELAVEDALHGHQRPKVEEYGETLFGVVQLLEIVDGEISIGEIDIFVGPNFVLSMRSRSQQSFLGVRERCEREPHLLQLGSAFVFYALIDAAVDRYYTVIEHLETELEEIEDLIFAKSSRRTNIERLYDFKRKVTKVRHTIAPLMEAVGKLYGGRVPKICANAQEYFRDVYDHLGRLDATTDELRDAAAMAMQVNLSMVGIEETEVTKQLAAWAGIFAIGTMFAGIWGMNFEGMPELKWDYGYPVAISVILGACAAMYWRFKRAGWL